MQKLFILFAAVSLLGYGSAAACGQSNSNSCSGCGIKGAEAKPSDPVGGKPVDGTPGISDAPVPLTVLRLQAMAGARRAADRKKALADSATLESMAEQFQKDTKDLSELTSADLKRLDEMARLVKSIKARLEE
jgi:hypothetical protein